MKRLLSLASACFVGKSEIIEFTSETMPVEYLDKKEFSVINFYDNSETSSQINMVF